MQHWIRVVLALSVSALTFGLVGSVAAVPFALYGAIDFGTVTKLGALFAVVGIAFAIQAMRNR